MPDTLDVATVAEEVTSLSDFAEPTGGAWPKGWYAAEVIEGYKTQKGRVFETQDALSAKGDSRNVRLCLNVAGPGGDRTMQTSLNYRPEDFTADRLAAIKQARQDHKGVQGKWSDAPDLQRSSLAVGKIGQAEEAFGFALRSSDNIIVASRALGQKVDVYLSETEEGYNDVTKFAKAGTKAK
jgi:hypothetical protein